MLHLHLFGLVPALRQKIEVYCTVKDDLTKNLSPHNVTFGLQIIDPFYRLADELDEAQAALFVAFARPVTRLAEDCINATTSNSGKKHCHLLFSSAHHQNTLFLTGFICLCCSAELGGPLCAQAFRATPPPHPPPPRLGHVQFA